MQPKISIIIPVYNVEKYLRQCLDSVVNQTMQEIQIICVNDGSTDGSLAILREYEARDSRMMVLDKPNGGQSSARNAAYPHVKGKYTCFVDSDDWIELDLCEKTYRKAEGTGAEITVFFYQREGGMNDTEARNYVRSIPAHDITTVQNKAPLFEYNSVCYKLWRSDLILNNRLFFPEGLYFEDQMVCWQGVTLAKRISVVPEQLYHYRCNPNSTLQAPENKVYLFDLIPIYRKIDEFLRESGLFEEYREIFIPMKLHIWHSLLLRLGRKNHVRIFQEIHKSLTADDREFYRTAPKVLIPKRVRQFYLEIDGSPIERMTYCVVRNLSEIVKMPERILRQWIVKPLKKLLKAA